MALETDPVGYIFGGTSGVPTYEELKRRRAIAVALASRQRGFPKTVGEGSDLSRREHWRRARRSPADGAGTPGRTAGAAQLAALRGASGYRAGTAPCLAGSARPPSAPLRPPAAPIPSRPSSQSYGGQAVPAAPPASAAGPAPSITATPILPSGPSSEDMTSGPPPSEFAMGGILNAAPLATPNLEPAFPGEEGGNQPGRTQPSPSGYGGQVLPSSGYLPPATAAAPPSQSPAPQATAPPAPGPQSSMPPPDSGDTPPNVLAQAQQVALQGGPAAVSRFMADAGYPEERRLVRTVCGSRREQRWRPSRPLGRLSPRTGAMSALRSIRHRSATSRLPGQAGRQGAVAARPVTSAAM